MDVEIEVKLEELDAILGQCDVVEGCKKRMINLLSSIYNNPLNIDDDSLNKTGHIELPYKGRMRKRVEFFLEILGIICLGLALPHRVDSPFHGSDIDNPGRLIYFLPGIVLLILYWVLEGGYSKKVKEAYEFNINIDNVYSEYITKTYEAMIKIHEHEMECGFSDMADYQKQELANVSKEILYEEEKLEFLYAAADVELFYRKREYISYLYDQLAYQDALSWEDALSKLNEKSENAN